MVNFPERLPSLDILARAIQNRKAFLHTDKNCSKIACFPYNCFSLNRHLFLYRANYRQWTPIFSHLSYLSDPTDLSWQNANASGTRWSNVETSYVSAICFLRSYAVPKDPAIFSFPRDRRFYGTLVLSIVLPWGLDLHRSANMLNDRLFLSSKRGRARSGENLQGRREDASFPCCNESSELRARKRFYFYFLRITIFFFLIWICWTYVLPRIPYDWLCWPCHRKDSNAAFSDRRHPRKLDPSEDQCEAEACRKDDDEYWIVLSRRGDRETCSRFHRRAGFRFLLEDRSPGDKHFEKNCWHYKSSLFFKIDVNNCGFLTVICYALIKLCVIFSPFFPRKCIVKVWWKLMLQL